MLDPILNVRDYAIFMIDGSGTIESWNLGAELIKGYTADEIIGQSITLFYTPEDLAAGKPAKLLAQARQHGHVEDEGWRVRKNGSRFWADVVITAVRDAAGEVVGFMKVTRDLTERRAAERARLAQEQRFRLLVERAREYAIYMLDPKGFVTSWNEGAERIKGYRADEIVGQHFSRFYAPDVAATGKCELELALALRDGRFEEEDWRLRKDGSRFWANVVIQPMFDPQGQHIGFSKITRDMTERVKSEAQRVELAHAQEALRLRDDFMSIAAHELRTPLVALQLQLDSLRIQGTNLEPKQVSKIDRALRNLDRLAELIASLLDASRITKGQLTLSPKRVELDAVIAEVVDRLQDTAHAAKCQVTTQLETGISGVWDPLRIGQVVANLLANAFKYAPGSAVTITLTRASDEALVRVEDRGPGIAEEHLQRVFERFERGSAPKTYAGMGLGLYLAREIVMAHRGTIRASNRDGGGAVIELRLPIEAPHKMPASQEPT